MTAKVAAFVLGVAVAFGAGAYAGSAAQQAGNAAQCCHPSQPGEAGGVDACCDDDAGCRDRADCAAQ